MTFAPKTVGVAGAGTMGIGIAQVCAMVGCKVLLFDTNEDLAADAIERISGNLQSGVDRNKITTQQKDRALARLEVVYNLRELKADLVFEAIIEDLDAKMELFAVLEEVNSQNTVFATNTSSIPVSHIAVCLQDPARFLGIHFFNPAHIMKLVEVISGKDTDVQIALEVKQWISDLGKIPVMAKDSPGFIVNRVARSFYTESLKQAEEEKATFESIDRLLEASGFRMGPFRLMDLIGVDTNYSVTTSMYELFGRNERFRPIDLQRKYLEKGWKGKKSGQGFYKYE